jgi:hypothetical protein
MNAIFTILSILSLLCGLFLTKGKFLKFFLFLVITLPFLNLNTKIHVNFQIPFFLFFFIGALIKNKYSRFSLRKIDIQIIALLIVFLIFVMLTIPLYFDHEIINIIKDLKFVVFGFILFLFAVINRDSLEKASLADMGFFLKWNFIITSIIFSLMYFFDLHRLLNSDAYFEINEVRYMNYGTFVIPFYTLFVLSNDLRIKKINWVYIVVPLLLSGNRTIIALLIFVSLVILLKRLSAKKLKILISSALSLLLFVFFIVKSASEDSPLYRIKKLLSLDYLAEAINTRLSPFYIALESFSFINYIVGKGLGFTYFIPWFHYRKNLDNYNIYLDSLIPSLYGKYGFFLILPLAIFVLYLKKFSDDNSFYFYLLFFVLLGLTNSFLYQNYFVLVLFIMLYLKSSTLKFKD